MGQLLQGLDRNEPTRPAETGRSSETDSRGGAFAAPDAETRRVLHMIVRTLDRLPE